MKPASGAMQRLRSWLLENGANPKLRNVHGKTALEIAQAQVESGCRATPIVIEQRKKEIEAGCREVISLLQRTGN